MTSLRSLAFAAVAVSALVASCAPEEAIVEIPEVDASMVGGFLSDPARSGAVAGIIGGDPEVAYRIDGRDPVIASPVVVGDTAFVSDGSGDLVAFDVATGDIVWRSVIGEADASVVASPDSIFSVSSAGVVRRHDPSSGVVAWEAELDRTTRSSPLLFDGGLWLAAGEELILLDPASGVLRTSVSLEARADSSPAAAGDVIVIGTRANALGIVDRQTFDVEFVSLPETGGEFRTYADGVAATPVISGSVIYVGSTTGSLVAVSLAGDIEWSIDLGSPIYGAVAIGDAVGFVPTGGGRLIAFDLVDGEILWASELGDAAYSSPVVIGEIVLATAENGTLFAFDTNSGEELWAVEVGEPGNYMASTPAVSGSLIVLGSNDGSIVGVESDR